jgi:hypothetical protein
MKIPEKLVGGTEHQYNTKTKEGSLVTRRPVLFLIYNGH